MKIRCQKSVCSALALAFTAGFAHAQSFTQSFDDVAGLAGAGWFVQNNSDPIGATGWFQGNAAVFSPFASPGYIGANFNNTTGVGTISNWLVTPQVTISNGDEVRFWTRSTGDQWPDRLELRMSTAGASTNVGIGAFDVGDFTTLLLSVNPDLLQGEYPAEWTAYTATVSGLGAPMSGRFALRYFVENGGPSGLNSDYIGIDEFQYSIGPIATGACEHSGGCAILSVHECQVFGGTYLGNNSDCPVIPGYEWTGNIPIPDGSGSAGCGFEAFADIIVPDNETVNGIRVGVHITHTWQGDLKFSLAHLESNTEVQLVDRPGVSASSAFGFSAANYGTPSSLMFFVDTAASQYGEPAVSPPGIAGVTGEWRAMAPLSAFVGVNSAGTWRLIAQDCAGGDTGALRVFRLELDLDSGCYANCTGATAEPFLTVDDFTCFINEFAAASALPHEQQVIHYANCDGSTTMPALTVDDFTCFINEFAAGCP